MGRRRYESGTTVLLAGTKRGLFLFTSKDRAAWKAEGPILDGGQVFNAILDQRGGSPRVFAADNNPIFGSVVRYSDDFGVTWHEPKTPIAFPASTKQSLENVWIVQPGRESEPETVYAGVDPASLWVSRDRGDTWEPDRGILDHPTRPRWQPGLGGLCMHSIACDPSDRNRMWVAASAVGVLRTTNNGSSWTFMNAGVPAWHLPDPYPEFGQCVHRLLVDPTNPDRLVQQNHHGMFESTDAGQKWRDIQANLPSAFGFPMAMDPHDPQTLFTIPQTAPDKGRHNIGDQFAVWRTTNGGAEWKRMEKGLPKGPQVRLGVLRHGMSTDGANPCGVYAGTGTGQLFASNDRGSSWQLVADYMPTIYSVNAATIA
ncbi:MAG: exo-alpha-sialidase [Actinomycetota bacterium]